MSTDEVDVERMLHAASRAHIDDFIATQPLGYNTRIGMEGNGISAGQRQRLLLARAVYKDPEYIFLDEATNSLDATNERFIMDNLRRYYRGKTVVVSAHRLSTIWDADQIIVMRRGEVAERGTHEELLRLQGDYYRLVKNHWLSKAKFLHCIVYSSPTRPHFMALNVFSSPTRPHFMALNVFSSPTQPHFMAFNVFLSPTRPHFMALNVFSSPTQPHLRLSMCSRRLRGHISWFSMCSRHLRGHMNGLCLGILPLRGHIEKNAILDGHTTYTYRYVLCNLSV